jgi:hypothetical protein
MAIVEPGKGRAVIEANGAGLRITIPAKAQAFVTFFLPFWLVAWAVGEVMVSRQLLTNPNFGAGGSIFAIAWLGAWTVGGAWAAAYLLWNIAGREIIELNSMILKRRKQIPIFSRSKEYAIANIANLRLAPASPQSLWYNQQNMSFLGFKEGTISFDYGRDTHYLASGLDEADAKYVIREMCKRVKSLCS